MNFEIYTTPLNTLLAPTLWYDSLLIIYTVGPSYLWVPHLQIQPVGFPATVGGIHRHRIHRYDGSLYNAIYYKGLEHPRIWVPVGSRGRGAVMEPVPLGNQGTSGLASPSA